MIESARKEQYPMTPEEEIKYLKGLLESMKENNMKLGSERDAARKAQRNAEEVLKEHRRYIDILSEVLELKNNDY